MPAAAISPPAPAGITVSSLIARFFPRELDRFLAGRQQSRLLLADAQALSPLHQAVAVCGLLALVVLPVVALRRRRFSLGLVALVVFVLAAAIGNAAITGGLSGPAVRYQARLAWLFVFAPAALLIAPAASVRRPPPVQRRGPA